MTVAAPSKTAVEPSAFFALLREQHIAPFVGVPCSLIQSLIAYAADHRDDVPFLFPAHESHALAIAAGAYMGSQGKELPLVFLQNSGFGNIINPLTSLHQIYEIPALLLVTWRAEEGYGTDAPEHWIVGRDMEQYFQTFHLPYRIPTSASWKEDLIAMKEEALRTKKPTVLCIRKGLFAPYEVAKKPGSDFPLASMDAIKILKETLADAVFLSTTGMLSRESFTVNDTPDFYMMGSMGLIGAVAAGAAPHTQKRVVALDGDGAALMHLGLLPFIGHQGQKNVLHVVLDNEAYSSTGAQPTLSPAVDFCGIAIASGYKHAQKATDEPSLRQAIEKLSATDGPSLLWVKVRSGGSHGIGRVSDKHTCPDVATRFAQQFQS